MALSDALSLADVDYWSVAESSPRNGNGEDSQRLLWVSNGRDAEASSEGRWLWFWRTTAQEPLSRALALALSIAVASRSLAGTTTLTVALFVADSRLRECTRQWRRSIASALSRPVRPPAVPRLARLATPSKAWWGMSRTGVKRFAGHWVMDADRSDLCEEQLRALGLPWAARVALARSPRTKTIHVSGGEWRESTKTVIVTRTEHLYLDGRPQTHQHPIDGSNIIVWTAIGARPSAAPAHDPGILPLRIPADSVVSVMYYERDASVATIVRTIEDAGRTYHVANDLQVRGGDRSDDEDDGRPRRSDDSTISSSCGVPRRLLTHTYFHSCPT